MIDFDAARRDCSVALTPGRGMHIRACYRVDAHAVPQIGQAIQVEVQAFQHIPAECEKVPEPFESVATLVRLPYHAL
jgi:hypothetical protein